MTENNIDIKIADGKYHFVQPQTSRGSAEPVQAFRNGEPWEAATSFLYEMRFTNWVWFLFMDCQETAQALRRANATLEAAGLPVEHSPVRLPPLGGQQAAPGKAPPHAPGTAL